MLMSQVLKRPLEACALGGTFSHGILGDPCSPDPGKSLPALPEDTEGMTWLRNSGGALSDHLKLGCGSSTQGPWNDRIQISVPLTWVGNRRGGEQVWRSFNFWVHYGRGAMLAVAQLLPCGLGQST